MYFADELRRHITDERTGSLVYQRLSEEADNLGFYSIGIYLRQMSMEESMHADNLEKFAAEVEGSGGGGSEHVRTLCPSSVADWAQLGERIKEKVFYDIELHANVNAHVSNIQYESPGAEDSKRWLTLKAGELGIQ